MIEIKGKVNAAICYATVVEGEAIEQIRRMCDYDFTAGSQIRIMPDVHAGKGCTIGTTMTITDKAVPNIVGVDIGCGMYTAELGKVDVDFEKVDAAAHDIPSGRDVWEGRMERFDLTGLRCYRNLKQAKRLERSLGTLGGGNHFIEIDATSDGTKYLVIHSGSRNLGKQVAELYQSLAIDLNAGKADYFERRDELIRTYKEQGRRAEIQTALKAMEKEWAAKEPTIPADLCYLYGTYLEDYLHDVEICQQFARRSRERMAEIILEKTGMTAISSFHTIHNYQKQSVFQGREEQIFIVLHCRAFFCIDNHITEFYRLAGIAGQSENVLNAGYKFSRTEWLWNIVVSTKIETCNRAVFVARCSEENDGDIIFGLNCLAGSKAVAFCQRYIEQDKIHLILCKKFHSSTLPRYAPDSVAFRIQKFRQVGNDGFIVLNQKYLRHILTSFSAALL